MALSIRRKHNQGLSLRSRTYYRIKSRDLCWWPRIRLLALIYRKNWVCRAEKSLWLRRSKAGFRNKITFCLNFYFCFYWTVYNDSFGNIYKDEIRFCDIFDEWDIYERVRFLSNRFLGKFIPCEKTVDCWMEKRNRAQAYNTFSSAKFWFDYIEWQNKLNLTNWKNITQNQSRSPRNRSRRRNSRK